MSWIYKWLEKQDKLDKRIFNRYKRYCIETIDNWVCYDDPIYNYE